MFVMLSGDSVFIRTLSPLRHHIMRARTRPQLVRGVDTSTHKPRPFRMDPTPLLHQHRYSSTISHLHHLKPHIKTWSGRKGGLRSTKPVTYDTHSQ
jgi:hypothetical protein